MVKKPKKPRTKAKELSDLLHDYARDCAEARVSLGDVVKLLESRSLGGLLLIFSLPVALPVPMPGISAVFGFILILVSVQMAVGSRKVWLPKGLSERSVTKKQFESLIEKTLPTLRRLEKVVKPRFPIIMQPWVHIPIGLACILLSLIVALPIPFGNVAPSLAMSLFALGLIQRDGLVISLALATTVLSGFLIAGAWASVKMFLPF